MTFAPACSVISVASTLCSTGRNLKAFWFRASFINACSPKDAIDTAALMLGTDKSRGYCLEMMCADFLAGAHFDKGDPEILLNSIS
jgi:hypothetical protein